MEAAQDIDICKTDDNGPKSFRFVLGLLAERLRVTSVWGKQNVHVFFKYATSWKAFAGGGRRRGGVLICCLP